jgi:hypothetical protein
MSSGQKPRTRAFFPRMKDRAAGRRARRARQRRALVQSAEYYRQIAIAASTTGVAFETMENAFNRLASELARQIGTAR